MATHDLEALRQLPRDARVPLRWLPPDATIPVGVALDALEPEEAHEEDTAPEPQPSPLELTWRERLWLVPAETRIGRAELLEAMGRTKSWLYRHTGNADDPIPHAKMDGELVFVVGQVRTWIREREDVVAAGPMESTAAERRIAGAVERSFGVVDVA